LDERAAAPERRVQQERRALRLDHAGLGALLVERWGLPASLATAVRDHHSSDSPGEMATVLRLADMVARHSDGHAVDRRLMLALAHESGLTVPALRSVLFDLPQSGSQRRRAEPSPLSKRETDALRQLAAGKVYKEVATALGVSASTVRSHLHSTYSKLGVEDRAQAVLLATERGWI
jgi:DNA-binding NarL/FixJ family response regulator